MNDGTYYAALMNKDRLIHIVDPDAGTCEALSVLFRLEGYKTAFSLDSTGFFSLQDRRHADVVMLNLKVDSNAGLSVLKRIRSHHTELPVFVLLDDRDVMAAVTAMKGGAADIVPKPIDTQRLVSAVAEALRDQARSRAAEEGRVALEVHGFEQLTPRERDVLQLIASGQSNKEAGRELGISPRTVEVHRARVMEKLGARNTADLIRIVLTS